MSRIRVYIKPFIAPDVYADEFTEISEDVIKLGSISQSLDNTTYDIGIFKNSGFSMKLRNDHGRFSDSASSRSIFQYKRQDTIVKVTWAIRTTPLKCGFFKAATQLFGEEITVFEGLLFDTSGVSSIDEQQIDFRIAGYETLLERVDVPFSSISNGDLFSELIYTMLNQSEITRHLTILEANITPGVDLAIDDKSELENKTIKGALNDKKVLLISNSVLYIQDKVVYVKNRDANATNEFSFYGQASLAGIENVISITDFRDGLNKLINFVTWEDTALKSSDTTSITKYGIRDKGIKTSLISAGSTAKIQSSLDSIKDEFIGVKRELKLSTPIGYGVLALFLKSRVNIDYPTIYKSADEGILPHWGAENWGQFRWPYGQYSLTIQSVDSFKVMGVKIDVEKDKIELQLREV